MSKDALFTGRWAIDNGVPLTGEAREAVLGLIRDQVGPAKKKGTTKSPLKGSILNEQTGEIAGQLSNLAGKKIAIVVGHEPGGGTSDERNYNKVVAAEMLKLLLAVGAKAEIFEHKYKSYGRRQNDTMARIKKSMGKPWVVIALHFDGYHKKSVKGHHFQYLGAKKLALAIRDRFEAHKGKPDSPRRYDQGIFKNTKDNGAGFLSKAAGWAVLVEPFFRSHAKSWAYWKNRQAELALIYCLGIADFEKS